MPGGETFGMGVFAQGIGEDPAGVETKQRSGTAAQLFH
jgi:hypothetical protein